MLFSSYLISYHSICPPDHTIQMTMDITSITASDPQVVLAKSSAAPDNPIESLDLIDSPKVRTKLRLYAILSALYVAYPALVFGEDHLANNTL